MQLTRRNTSRFLTLLNVQWGCLKIFILEYLCSLGFSCFIS